ncbi:MAG: hydroxysqualene dehydroxylase HpnE [Candidatus Kapaibacterium sp.]
MSRDDSAKPPVIIGGGMAGIAAAVALAERGLRPLLLESRPYMGGRTRSFLHAGTGDEIDNGQHLMMGCYHSTLRLLETLGTRNLVAIDPALRVEFRDADGSADILSAHTPLPSPLDVLAGMLRLKKLSVAERFALARLGARLVISSPTERETVSDYLRRLGQSERACARLWDPIVIATLNTPPKIASARLFATVMRRAFLGRGDDSHLAFPLAGLSRLIEPAERYIAERGGRIVTGATVERIEREGNEFRIGLKDGEMISTERLIAAVPARAIARIMSDIDIPGSIAIAGTSLASAPIVSLYLWYDAPLDHLPKFAALIGTNVQWMFNRRRITGERNDRYPGLLSCTISAAFEESAASGADIAIMADRELRGAFPEIGAARLLDTLVIKEKQATFAATPDAEAVRPPARTVLPGFYLAGDWTATSLPATIEGAVQSGYAAANALLADGG